MLTPEFIVKHKINALVLRYSEIGLKSDKVRKRLEKQLINNAIQIYRKFGVKYRGFARQWGRIYFYFPADQIQKAIHATKYVFGVMNFSPAIEISNEIETIIETAMKLCKDRLVGKKSFGIKARRVKAYPIKSPEIGRIVGGKIAELFPEVRVNLSSPDYKLNIEVREEKAYLFDAIVETYWQGMPLEENKIVLGQTYGRFVDFLGMMLLMRRGVIVFPILFDLGRFAPQNSLDQKLDQARLLNAFFPGTFRVGSINFVDILQEISEIALQVGIPICTLCFYCRMKLLEQVFLRKMDIEKEKGIVYPEISQSPGRWRSFGKLYRGNYKGVIIGLSLTPENYCPTRLDNSLVFSDFKPLLLTPNIGWVSDEIQAFKALTKKSFLGLGEKVLTEATETSPEQGSQALKPKEESSTEENHSKFAKKESKPSKPSQGKKPHEYWDIINEKTFEEIFPEVPRICTLPAENQDILEQIQFIYQQCEKSSKKNLISVNNLQNAITSTNLEELLEKALQSMKFHSL